MINLTEERLKEFEASLKEQMDKAIKHFEGELLSIRSGRASAAMVQDLKVDVYGQDQKMKAVATISTPDARLIIIQPWDKGMLGEISKSITNSDLGATPVIDGGFVRIALPLMTTERREEMVKVLRSRVEEAKVRIRNIRREYNEEVRSSQKDGDVSEDFGKRVSEWIQKSTDAHIATIDQISQKKEQELKLV